MSGVSVALTGASGLQYGLRLVQTLAGAGETVHLLVSDAARVVAGLETDTPLPRRSAELHRQLVGALDIDPARLHVYSDQQWTAPLASGSAAPKRMVVCPCTTGTLAAIAGGHSDSLIERAADVVLKERGQLVVVPRETPLSAIHLEHMLSLTRLGVVVLPANPGFYHRPQRVEDLIDFVVARILDHLDVAHDLGPRWGKESD
ncbi:MULTISPECIES: flavin prenyltransferase UbiX [unclassified Halorhodospira]|uniref:flavin prenyltransferase UbiX n=1 Tax=unclassified Halorhodospira TaxID=2626748 RepID=UPI001EE89CCF|nr:MULTISPECIES: flavin prenyltransferase UbiX [unclassified Halorhodospira]MCG5539027.1 UbiX family flavin prenyltransferase [Halorhodospira sp. 9622]MCG5541964.1 UbiX family flavin prenyltransferase [Halorhodospira sp. M39old]MCG5546703.1 UbiX family flavin prenyltransferase [Halorhodospira sp. M38]